MPLAVDRKKSLIEQFRTHEGDTGSPEVQIALLTERVNGLTDHFQKHAKDHHSRRGLLMLIGSAARCLTICERKTPSGIGRSSRSWASAGNSADRRDLAAMGRQR